MKLGFHFVSNVLLRKKKKGLQSSPVVSGNIMTHTKTRTHRAQRGLCLSNGQNNTRHEYSSMCVLPETTHYLATQFTKPDNWMFVCLYVRVWKGTSKPAQRWNRVLEREPKSGRPKANCYDGSTYTGHRFASISVTFFAFVFGFAQPDMTDIVFHTFSFKFEYWAFIVWLHADRAGSGQDRQRDSLKCSVRQFKTCP